MCCPSHFNIIQCYPLASISSNVALLTSTSSNVALSLKNQPMLPSHFNINQCCPLASTSTNVALSFQHQPMLPFSLQHQPMLPTPIEGRMSSSPQTRGKTCYPGQTTAPSLSPLATPLNYGVGEGRSHTTTVTSTLACQSDGHGLVFPVRMK